MPFLDKNCPCARCKITFLNWQNVRGNIIAWLDVTESWNFSMALVQLYQLHGQWNGRIESPPVLIHSSGFHSKQPPSFAIIGVVCLQEIQLNFVISVLCSSRKYPYSPPPHSWFLFYCPPPKKFQFSFMLCL